MLETFTAQTFTPLVGQPFRIGRADGPPVEIELIKVTEWGSLGSGGRPDGPPRTPFALLFRGPQAGSLPQQIYPVEHDQLGAFDLFLVPVGPDDAGMRYEAIFT
jgi:hypothetical protein